MKPTITLREREQLLKRRARRLLFFVETFDGRPNRAIELEAYLILQTFETRPRAIWRYIRYALREWRNKWQFRIALAARVWWYRRIKGLEARAALDLAHEVIEAKIFASTKGDPPCA